MANTLNLFRNGAVGFIDWLGDLGGILASGDQPYRLNGTWHYDPATILLTRCERNYRIFRPLWLPTLHTDFIWLLGIDAVDASVDAAARKRERSDLLDVLASKASSIWSADVRRRKRGARGEYGRREHHQCRDARAHRLTRWS